MSVDRILREQNLMIVAAVEGYSLKNGLSPVEAFSLLQQHNVFSKIRASYGVLHTQSLDESLCFAEDIVNSATQE